ncbi:TDP-N-acetylfucosamine:lipid II N-acetylfucosaminyltransferase [Qipengyuania aquimaris]|uniref:TDP-N-acetylfucosamine:lipid II N-acetylfucosaminyltransferase n=1 Tax=Qipengyuania aquimaris TaxID=255984 RepID=A0A9Q3XCY4_9SPHN|nr:TDP-N-acetylfucosamine:lipid II N-acetylfucosaminyltransferase [Qipengyuania aquimaris]
MIEQDDPDAVENCLLLVWSEEEAPDIEFDRANDVVKGGAISCSTGASPSRFEAAIAALREAARSGDKARILAQLGIPLLYIDENGERQDLTEEQVEALFDDIFDPNMLDMLQRLDLSQMTVEKEKGAFFALGSLWLVVDEKGQPKVVTVNRQALLEAATAAVDQADLGQGRPID